MRFRSLIDSSTKQVNLQCADAAGESVQKYPSLLIKEELYNGIKDTLGVEPDLTGYPILLKKESFEESNELAITDSYLQTVESIANRTAQQFYTSVKDKKNDKWSCDVNEDCLSMVTDQISKYLWRRPLITSEKSTLTQLADNFDSNEQKIVGVLTFLLSAPQAFIRNVSSVSATNGSLVSLWTQAESMAFILGSTFTPKDLFDKIENKEIVSHQDIYDYAESYLSSDVILARSVDNIYGIWLGFKSAINSDVDFDGRKVSAIAKEERERVYNLVKANKPLTSILMDAGKGHLDSQFFAWGTFDTEEDSSPIYRGLKVLDDLMCFGLAEAELSAATEEQIQAVLNQPDFPTDGNNLEKMAYHSSNAACSSCHQYIDPAAIGLEKFDPFGKVREVYPNGDPITFVDTKFAGEDYSNYSEYVGVLEKTFDYKHCFAQKLHHKIRKTSDAARTNSCFMTQIFQGSEEPGLETLILNTLKTDLVRKENKPTY